MRSLINVEHRNFDNLIYHTCINIFLSLGLQSNQIVNKFSFDPILLYTSRISYHYKKCIAEECAEEPTVKALNRH